MADSELAIAGAEGVTTGRTGGRRRAGDFVAALRRRSRATDPRRFADRGGYAVVDERKARIQVRYKLAAILGRLLGDLARRLAMAQAMSRLARPEATVEVAAVIARLAFARRRPVVLRRRPLRDAEPLMAATLS